MTIRQEMSVENRAPEHPEHNRVIWLCGVLCGFYLIGLAALAPRRQGENQESNGPAHEFLGVLASWRPILQNQRPTQNVAEPFFSMSRSVVSVARFLVSAFCLRGSGSAGLVF